ncbi:MAG: NAD-dependent epimerase/dehydratase family protein [Chloroflexi bacterium]|nr:NAD-dependent epimerase/dehydratase family protein [Chloroflexota bacterium]
MATAVVTGSSGLIGSETSRFFHEKGMDIVGIDNNLRRYFFGADGDVNWNRERLKSELPRYVHVSCDIRDEDAIGKLFRDLGKDIVCVIHAAAQPSHDWAAKEPFTDFTVNANGTLVMLEAARKSCPEVPFIFTSTNKVYGDAPNRLPLVERDKRWEVNASHPYAEHGIDESMSIDQSKHSLFGASKVAADVLVQEYGRYFGMRTVCFRGGCLTGPAHSGAELHGFLAYLVKCAITGRPYKVLGYKGKQVRDNIHAWDLVNAFWHVLQDPRSGAVYNMGGSRHSNCSMLEAIDLVEEMGGRRLNYSVLDDNRVGDHIWYVSDVRAFQKDYPEWRYRYDLRAIVGEIIAAVEEREK